MKRSNNLIQFFSLLFIILGSFTLSFFFITSWAHSLIFDTNYYLNIVTPLPQNSDVAKAMSTYTVDTLFKNTNIEQKITDALPEQAKFLSPTLSDNLQDKSYQLTTQIIQSDQFSSVWVAANTIFHKRIIEVFRGGGLLSQIREKQFLENTSFQFDGSQLIQTIKNRLGSESELFSDAQVQQFKAIAVPIYTKLEKIRQIVYWITQLSSMLLPASLALILYGAAISFSRQKAFLVAGIFIAISMITTLVTLSILKTDFLNNISQPVYNSAANVVWDSFLEALKQPIRLTLVGGLILALLALLAGPYQWAKNFRDATGFSKIHLKGFTKFRLSLARYSIWLYLLGLIIVSIALLTITTVTISTVVIAFSLLFLYYALLAFILPREKIATD